MDEFVRFNSVLSAKFTSTTTNREKKEAYDTILSAVNAVTSTSRSLDSIKEKWQSLKKNVKAKWTGHLYEAKKETGKTGGGPPNGSSSSRSDGV